MSEEEDWFQQIEGDPLDDPPPTDKKIKVKTHKPKGPHIGCPIEWLAWVAPLVTSKEQLMMALYVYRQCVIAKSPSAEIKNLGVEQLGFSRYGKYRVLRKLEEAGVLTATYPTGCHPYATLTRWP